MNTPLTSPFILLQQLAMMPGAVVAAFALTLLLLLLLLTTILPTTLPPPPVRLWLFLPALVVALRRRRLYGCARRAELGGFPLRRLAMDRCSSAQMRTLSAAAAESVVVVVVFLLSTRHTAGQWMVRVPFRSSTAIITVMYPTFMGGRR